jgi:chorismate mutase/prephenate dehydratase
MKEKMADHNRELGEVRRDIDSLDAELVRLLNRRAELAQEVGQIKGETGSPFFTPEREKLIYERLKDINPGPLNTHQMVNIFREVISAARAAEKPLKVTYWGPAGTFTHRAAILTFGSSTNLSPADTIGEVFSNVEKGVSQYGVVPVENSVAGIVPETLDCFVGNRCKVVAETFVDVAHHLVSFAPDLGSIKTVLAGPQPSGQCRKWLRSNLPQAEILEIMPTARAVMMAKEDPTTAAIANRLASEIHEVPILAESIQDNAINRTRFWVLGFNEPARTGKDKTSLLFHLRNRPGELYLALGAFMEQGVNLQMIESRRSPKGAFEYLFFADCDGHQSEDALKNALAKLSAMALEVTILGSYPASETSSA